MTTFLSASFAAGALILLTALVRRFAGNRLPRRMYIALWDIAVLRLLIPVGLPRADGALAAYVQTTALNQSLQAETVTADMVEAQALSGTTETGFQLSETVRAALPVLWAAVALGLALYFIAAYVRSTRAFAQSLPDDDPRCAAFLQAHSVATHSESVLMLDADTRLYVEKDGGRGFHSTPNCTAIPESARDALEAFSAEQLGQSPYSLLSACPVCFETKSASESGEGK